MERIEYRDIIDRNRFEESGPWDDEPDKIQWQDATGYPCLIVRNGGGALCGYVGVSEGHPMFGKDYEAAEDLAVHGGITFAGPCQEDDKEHGICHIPAPGEPDHVWWLGFDCAHGGDITPSSIIPSLRLSGREIYRDVSYVTAECTTLAVQLKAMEVRR